MKRVLMKSTTHKGKWMVSILLFALLACLLIPVGALLLYSPGKPKSFLTADGTPLANSISEKSYAAIGSVEQGMFIRGKHTQNPVLLFLHGDPGIVFFKKKELK